MFHTVLTQQNLIPTVRLKNGLTIFGTTNKTFIENKIYYSFRGIPYAEPPIGKLRFKAPQPLSGNFSNENITAFKDALPCIGLSLLQAASEDCLYLNIYTPQFPGQNNPSLLPVMVWVYGGAFVSGDGSYATFGPDFFLDEGNVMIVTFNYREGIFGFLSTGDEAAPGNYGLKDQVLVLQWVQENIRSFGGNPERVTIFGESSGAASVSYLTQTPLTKGLFHGVILQSGTSLNSWALTRNAYARTLNAARIFRIDASTNQTLVDGLRNVHAFKLRLLHSFQFLFHILHTSKNGLPFGPTIEPSSPGAIIINKSHEQLKNGLFHDVPYIIGFNSLEAKSIIDATNFQYIISRILSRLPKYMKIIKYIIELIWPFLNINLIVPVVRSYLQYFPQASASISLNINHDNYAGYWIALYYSNFESENFHKFLSDDQFTRPILEAVRLYSQKAPVYLYRFSYEGSLSVGGNISSVPGAGHGDDLLYMWRWRDSYDLKNLPPSDLLTRKRLIRLWTNFAITGNPTPVKDPILENVKWKPVNTRSLTYLDIGKKLTAGVNYNKEQFIFWNYLFYFYGNPPYSTY